MIGIIKTLKQSFTHITSVIVAVVIASAAVLSCINDTYAADKLTITMPSNIILESQENNDLAPGVSETLLMMTNRSDYAPINGYVINVNLSANAKIVANYGKYYNEIDPAKRTISTWKHSKTTSQASRYASATGERVVAAVNGDYYKTSSAKPLGALVLEGKTYHEASDRPFFAITKNGKAIIKDAGGKITDNINEAVGGSILLVKNGSITKNVSPYDTKRSPCNNIGIKADGSVVIFLADGRDSLESVGLTYYEQAEMLVALGCVTAMGLDGGGSVTYASMHEYEESLVIQNEPSDGKERSVASTLMVIDTSIPPVTVLTPANMNNNSSTTTGSSSKKTKTKNQTGSDSGNKSDSGSASDSKNDSKNESKKESKDDSKKDSKGDSKTDKSESKIDSNSNNSSTSDSKKNSKSDSKEDSGSDSKKSTKSDSKNSTGSNKNSKSDSKNKSESGSKKSSKSDSKKGSGSVKFKIDGNYYKITDSKKKTVAYCGTVDKNATKITIPATIKKSKITYKITAVASKACYNNKKLKSLIIGKNITKIGSKAFYKCSSLKKIRGCKYVNCRSQKEFLKKYVIN